MTDIAVRNFAVADPRCPPIRCPNDPGVVAGKPLKEYRWVCPSDPYSLLLVTLQACRSARHNPATSAPLFRFRDRADAYSAGDHIAVHDEGQRGLPSLAEPSNIWLVHHLYGVSVAETAS